jgi:CubicO group peptidase (beta-lactamase class C family)
MKIPFRLNMISVAIPIVSTSIAAFSIFALVQWEASAVVTLGSAELQKPTDSVAGTSTGGPELTAADLEAFLDGLVPLQIKLDDIAGATISVVKDGKLMFAKGYGYADIAAKRPVSPDNTLFRPGSIGKLFTWTAIMQLVEKGKIDLDADVNSYIDFKIPEPFGRPVTVRNLMTHTPGFEESIKELIVERPEDLDYGRWLKTNIPRQIFPPGTVPAYSNYGASLGGYIVERVSGEPFVDYVDNHIFKPLGMTRSTYRQPLP